MQAKPSRKERFQDACPRFGPLNRTELWSARQSRKAGECADSRRRGGGVGKRRLGPAHSKRFAPSPARVDAASLHGQRASWVGPG